jgi:hypothetical protein
VLHYAYQRPFNTVCTIWTWFGDVVSCRDCPRLVMSVHVPSLCVRLAGLLREDLVVRPASYTCSAWTWSLPLPLKLAQQGFSRLPCLAGLLDGDLVVRPAS